MRLITASLIGLLTASPLMAQEPVAQEPVRENAEHVVRKGDTLWDLAGRYFTNPFQWPVIYQANTSVVEDPHWIYPNEVLVIPGIAANGRVGLVPSSAGPTERSARTVFYRRPPVRASQPTVLSEPGQNVFPVKMGEFMSAPYLLGPERLDVRGTFLRSIRDDRDVPGAPSSAHPQDRVYVAYTNGQRPAVGDRLAVVDVGRRATGARGNERVIEPRAVIRVLELGSEVLEGQVESQFGPVFPGQLLVPMTMFPDFQVEAAVAVGGFDLEGRILEFAEEQPLYGPSAIAFLDVGAQHGVREGDVFHAYLPARRVGAGEPRMVRTQVGALPPELVAELRVIRVTDDHATVRVDRVSQPRLAVDLPVQRVRRIP